MKTLQSMYSDVLYSIKLDKGTSNTFSSSVGVKQGCVLSPLLFNIFLSDLPNSFDASCDPVIHLGQSLSCLMFADDMILLSKSPSGLQSCLDKLNIYCKQWHLIINISKTKILIFSKSGRSGKKCQFFLDGGLALS